MIAKIGLHFMIRTPRISNVSLTVPYPKQETSSTMVASYFIKVYFNIVLTFKSKSSKLPFLFEFSD
jgi:branched-subunit amino acid permease